MRRIFVCKVPSLNPRKTCPVPSEQTEHCVFLLHLYQKRRKKKPLCREVALEKLTVWDLPSFGTDRLSRNVGNKLPLYGAQNPKRTHILFTPRWKPETRKTDSCSARKDIPHLLRSPEVHPPFNNSPPLNQNQPNSSRATSLGSLYYYYYYYYYYYSIPLPRSFYN